MQAARIEAGLLEPAHVPLPTCRQRLPHLFLVVSFPIRKRGLYQIVEPPLQQRPTLLAPIDNGSALHIG